MPSQGTDPRAYKTFGTVTPWEVATMMRRAGFPEKEIPHGVAVMLAESSGHVTADNGTHVGLFQIGDDKGYDRDKLKNDPQYNVNAAFQVWKRQGWYNGWDRWESGAWMKHLAEGVAALASSKKMVQPADLGKWTVHSDDTSALHEVVDPLPGGDTAYNAVKTGVGGVGDLIGILTNLDTWERAGEVVGGFVLMVTGFVLLVRNQL